MIINNKNDFDASYDVLVLGFGGAGATAARFASDAGAKVLLVDSAPEGNEGGNTRYAGELVAYEKDPTEFKSYFESLLQGFNVDPQIEKVVIKGVTSMKEYFNKYLDIKEPYNLIEHPDNAFSALAQRKEVSEYPEFPGGKNYSLMTVHKGMFDGALWKVLRQKVLDRADNITVWYSSPAKHLITGTDRKTVVGAQIERNGHVYNIEAKNGVVLATGGFENNQQMIQDYIGAKYLAPLGSLYNKGDGINLAQEVGAQKCHMTRYNAAGVYQNYACEIPNGERAALILNTPAIASGSIFAVGTDGTRYFKEDSPVREGFVYKNGMWDTPQVQLRPKIIFDQKKYNELANDPSLKEITNHAIKADTINELAEKINVDADKLNDTVSDFNLFAKKQHDYAFHREPKSLTVFDEKGPFYAVPMVQTVMATQGGPKKNANAEIVDSYDKPIPHLYAAGELGSYMNNLYQGGSDLADCLIFGKIAGENAALKKLDNPFSVNISNNTSNSEKIQNPDLESDLGNNLTKSFSTKDNQYIGKSNIGMGDDMIVRVTVDSNQNIKKVEVLKDSETEHGSEALNIIPQEIVKQNSYKVDTVTGATVSSNCIKEAVKDALSKIKK